MSSKEEYYWYKSHHICTDCHCREAFYNHTLCEVCIEKRQNRTYIRPEESKKKNVEHKKKLYHERKEQGLCVRCGKKALKGKTMCLNCNIANNKRAQTNRDKYKIYNPNKCRYCEKDCVEGKKVCQEHLEKLREQATYARTFVNIKEHIWNRTGENNGKSN